MSHYQFIDATILVAPAALGLVTGAVKGYCDAQGTPVPPGTLDSLITYAPAALTAVWTGASAYMIMDVLKGEGALNKYSSAGIGGVIGGAVGAAATAIGYGAGYGVGKIV